MMPSQNTIVPLLRFTFKLLFVFGLVAFCNGGFFSSLIHSNASTNASANTSTPTTASPNTSTSIPAIASSTVPRDVGCQNKGTHGREYNGTANTTAKGTPCEMWSDATYTFFLDIGFTHVGEHNYCRNPVGSKKNAVWCLVNLPFVGPQPCWKIHCFW